MSESDLNANSGTRGSKRGKSSSLLNDLNAERLRPMTLRLKMNIPGVPNLDRQTLINLIQEQYGQEAIRGMYHKELIWYVNVTGAGVLEEMLEGGLIYVNKDGQRQVIYFDGAGEEARTVVLSALDPSVPDDLIVEVLGKFGFIHSRIPLRREIEDGLENGKRAVKMTIKEDIPQNIRLIRKGTFDETLFGVSYPNQKTNLKLYTYVVDE